MMRKRDARQLTEPSGLTVGNWRKNQSTLPMVMRNMEMKALDKREI